MSDEATTDAAARAAPAALGEPGGSTAAATAAAVRAGRAPAARAPRRPNGDRRTLGWHLVWHGLLLATTGLCWMYAEASRVTSVSLTTALVAVPVAVLLLVRSSPSRGSTGRSGGGGGVRSERGPAGPRSGGTAGSLLGKLDNRRQGAPKAGDSRVPRLGSAVGSGSRDRPGTRYSPNAGRLPGTGGVEAPTRSGVSALRHRLARGDRGADKKPTGRLPSLAASRTKDPSSRLPGLAPLAPGGKGGPAGKRAPGSKFGPGDKGGPAGKRGPGWKVGPGGKAAPGGKAGPGGTAGPGGKAGPGDKAVAGKAGSSSGSSSSERGRLGLAALSRLPWGRNRKDELAASKERGKVGSGGEKGGVPRGDGKARKRGESPVLAGAASGGGGAGSREKGAAGAVREAAAASGGPWARVWRWMVRFWNWLLRMWVLVFGRTSSSKDGASSGPVASITRRAHATGTNEEEAEMSTTVPEGRGGGSKSGAPPASSSKPAGRAPGSSAPGGGGSGRITSAAEELIAALRSADASTALGKEKVLKQWAEVQEMLGTAEARVLAQKLGTAWGDTQLAETFANLGANRRKSGNTIRNALANWMRRNREKREHLDSPGPGDSRLGWDVEKNLGG